MPTYDWKCPADHVWSVVSTVDARNNSQDCVICGNMGDRMITAPNISDTARDWNRQGFNPGLGCYTKSWAHGREIAKARGLEEVGNERPEVIHKQAAETQQAKHEARWKLDGGPLL